jgi:uncharacterized protein YndB with AHSA1/START domain
MPAIVARWMSPTGYAIAEIDPTVGGQLRVVMVGAGVEIEHTGRFLEVVPDERLVFTWVSPYTGDGPSRVTVELRSIGAETVLTLLHEQLPSQVVESHAGGWGGMLDRLAAELVLETPAAETTPRVASSEEA